MNTGYYIFDKIDGEIEMYKEDRRNNNRLASSKCECIGEFMRMFCLTLESMKDDDSIIITATKVEH